MDFRLSPAIAMTLRKGGICIMECNADGTETHTYTITSRKTIDKVMKIIADAVDESDPDDKKADALIAFATSKLQ